MSDLTIYPAILTDQMTVLQEQLTLAGQFPDCEVVQVDIIDGFFADNLTITPIDLLFVEKGELQCELHLMVEEPLDYVLELEEQKDQLHITAIIGQVERMTHEDAFLQEVQRLGWQAGLSLDVNTPLESIDDHVWKELDILQLMAVPVGLQGQQFVEHTHTKLQQARQYLDEIGSTARLLVDGGISLKNLSSVKAHGASGVVVGSALWLADDPSAVWQKLR